MKKGQIVEGTVVKTAFPCSGTVQTDEGDIIVKNVLPGQKVRVRVLKKRHGKASGQLIEILERAYDEKESECPHFDQVSGCGGCIYQTLPYDKQLELKEGQVRDLILPVVDDFDSIYEGAGESPLRQGFRNKMEFTFGDEYKDGPLALGMHKRGGFYDIITTCECRIMDEDYRKILKAVLDFSGNNGLSYYHRVRHSGFLRHLLVRKAASTGQILIAIVTSSMSDRTGQDNCEVIEDMAAELCKLDKGELSGKIEGIIHVINDSVADAVKCDSMRLLYGKDHFFEQLLGLTFRITPFSFFQTNTKGAEVLYETVREYALGCISGSTDDRPVIFDLYSGTGTIAQILAPVASKVVGVEIVAEAVEAARENAALNGLDNCEFITGDVLKVIDEIDKKPDLIILDPPRDGIHPKALPKILNFGVDHIVYISCKPSSLARDLLQMRRYGYEAQRIKCVDMFPFSGNVETVVLLNNKFAKVKDFVQIGIDAEDYYGL